MTVDRQSARFECRGRVAPPEFPGMVIAVGLGGAVLLGAGRAFGAGWKCRRGALRVCGAGAVCVNGRSPRLRGWPWVTAGAHVAPGIAHRHRLARLQSN